MQAQRNDLAYDHGWLYERYVVRNMTSPEIAAELGCSYSTILRALRICGIPTRTVGPRPVIEIGQRFGQLVVLAEVERRHEGRAYLCRCDCGNETVVGGSRLRRESQCCVRCTKRTHGHTSDRRHTPTYNSWSGMNSRCFNPNHRHFKHYGGRGITVCDRWRHSFENFLADMGEKPAQPAGLSIDRIDNDGNYEPGNCRWADQKTQANNQRPRKARH